MVNIEDIIEENILLVETVSKLTKSLKTYEWMRSVEKKRDDYVREVVKAAADPHVSKETVMEFVSECARTLYEGQEVEGTLHAILYQVRPMIGKAYDIIRKGEGTEGVDLNDVLYCVIDTNLSGNGKTLHVLPEERRYLSVKRKTISGDAYLKRMPVSSLNDKKSHKVSHVHEAEYDKSRWPNVDQRAAFPFINPLSSKVEYVLVIDKGGNAMTEYDIRFIRDFVRDASNVLAIKQVMEEDRSLYDSVREGLHNLSTSRAVIGMYLEDLAARYTKDWMIPKLCSQFERFERVIDHIRKGEKVLDIAYQDLGRIVRSVAESYHAINSDIRLDTEIPENVSAWYDRFVMANAIENMLKNVAETDAEKKEVVIRIEKKDDNYHLLTVKDNCGGIQPDLFETIFQRPGVTSKSSGSGIGVHSVLRSLRETGCIVDIFNNYNFGLEYQVLIPRNKV